MKNKKPKKLTEVQKLKANIEGLRKVNTDLVETSSRSQRVIEAIEAVLFAGRYPSNTSNDYGSMRMNRSDEKPSIIGEIVRLKTAVARIEGESLVMKQVEGTLRKIIRWHINPATTVVKCEDCEGGVEHRHE